jgi:ribosomal-protein-alanine N-acetyltransferase
MSALDSGAGRGCSGPLNVVLRPMTGADLDEVVSLEHQVFGAEAWTRQMLAGELEQQPASRYYLVADDDGQLAGYAGMLAAGWQADVVTVAVAADRWGRGIGSALLEALLAEAARRGCREVFLEVRTDNTRAQELYRRYRFTEMGIRKGYYQPSGADALVMRRSLAVRAGASTAEGSGGPSPRTNRERP